MYYFFWGEANVIAHKLVGYKNNMKEKESSTKEKVQLSAISILSHYSCFDKNFLVLWRYIQPHTVESPFCCLLYIICFLSLFCHFSFHQFFLTFRKILSLLWQFCLRFIDQLMKIWAKKEIKLLLVIIRGNTNNKFLFSSIYVSISHISIYSCTLDG